MAVRIIVDVFSGRANPVIELEGKWADSVLERLRPKARGLRQAASPEDHPILGYRGLVVEQTGESVPGVPRRFRFSAGLVEVRRVLRVARDESAEKFIFAPGGPAEHAGIDQKVLAFVRREARDVEGRRARLRATTRAPRTRRGEARRAAPASGCASAPIFEPQWWNDGAQKQLRNNCYNYSTNYRTDTFAQPGRANGVLITSLSCAAIKPLALLDNLIDARLADNQCPATGHLVALVMAPGFDFHWYRKGVDGMWTHKVGPAPATALDNAGNVIADPRTANRGPYTAFCGFMIVMHGHINLA